MNQIQSNKMNIFYKNLSLWYSYINVFYNICIGTVEKQSAHNLKTVNQDDLCRTYTKWVYTAMATIAPKAVPHLLLRSLPSACTKQATFKHSFQTQYWPGTVAYSAGLVWLIADSRINARSSLCQMYACSEGKAMPLPCYTYA